MGGLGAGVRQGKLKLGVVCAKPAKIVGLLGDRFPPTFYNVSPVSISTRLSRNYQPCSSGNLSVCMNAKFEL